MSWQILIFLSIIFGSICTLLQRVLLKDEASDGKTYSIFFQLLTGLMIGGFGLFFADMSFPSNLKPLIIGFIIMILLYGFGNVFIFQALRTMEASRLTIVLSSRAFFTFLASFLIFGEVLTIKQIIGVLLIAGGVILANIKSAKLNFDKKETVALLAAACFGFAVSNDNFMLKTFNLYPYVFLAFVAPALFILVLNPYTLKKMTIFFNKDIFIKMLLLCFLYAVQAILFFTALQVSSNSSQIASVSTTSVIVTVIMAIIFLKERQNIAEKIFGSILSLIGLFLLI